MDSNNFDVKRFNVLYARHDGLGHIQVATVYAVDKDTVFDIMNDADGDTPNPLESVVAQAWIRKFHKVNHTSMSVGDIVVDADNDLKYRCDPVGWELIK